MDRRKKLLYMAVTVAILGTASLYLLSASLEHEKTDSGEAPADVRSVLYEPWEYTDREMTLAGNISDIRNYGNVTVFYLRDEDYSLRCVSYENITVEEGSALITGRLHYNEKWGRYEFVVEQVE